MRENSHLMPLLLSILKQRKNSKLFLEQWAKKVKVCFRYLGLKWEPFVKRFKTTELSSVNAHSFRRCDKRVGVFERRRKGICPLFRGAHFLPKRAHDRFVKHHTRSEPSTTACFICRHNRFSKI